jgi:hypothetical protein
MKVLSCVLIAILIASCGGSGKVSDSQETGFFSIGFENAIENKKEFTLSEIAEDIRYISLETNDSCLLRRVVDYAFTDSVILIRNFDHILKFSLDGEFLQRIGKSGKGPGEIDLIRIMSVIPEKEEIAVQLNWKRELYFFDFAGNLVRRFDFKSPVSFIKVCPDGNYIYHERGSGGNDPYTFCLIGQNLDTLSVVRNNQFWKNTSNMVISIGYPDFDEFHISGGRMYLKSMYNDTVYTVAGNKFIPAYFLDLGKFRLPEDLRPEKLGPDGIQQFRDNSDKYFWGNVFSTPGKIFFAAHSYADGIPSRYVLYDIRSQTGSYLTDGNDPAKGFLNDMDGIIDFWPLGSINEKQVYMTVSVLDLKKGISEGTIRTVKDQQKQQEIRKKIMAMEDTDNPVLVVVTLK